MSNAKQDTAILVVEDELAIQRGLCDALAFHGYRPHGVATGDDGLREALSGAYALVLLDVMLPGMSGFDVCRKVRAARPEQLVLMLTARGSESDVLEGFRCGSDDYVTKPFSVAQLMARVEAILRRANSTAAEPVERFEFGDWWVDPGSLEAVRDDEAMELTRREVGMLALFLREAGRIVSRRTLLTEIWGMKAVENIQTRTVDMHIAKLRKKLGSAGRSQIETVRGEGYRFAG